MDLLFLFRNSWEFSDGASVPAGPSLPGPSSLGREQGRGSPDLYRYSCRESWSDETNRGGFSVHYRKKRRDGRVNSFGDYIVVVQ